MSKTIFSKMKLSLVALLFAIVFVCVGSMMFAKAESSITTLYDVTSFKMDSADLIVEGDEGINGLNFTASISADEFGAINALVGEGKTYTSIETGLIILPAYFMMDGSLGFPSESTLFGEGAVYGWSEYADGEWQEYTGDKVQIININANNWVDVGDKYTYSGAIVNLHDHNETVAFFSIAYVRAFDSYGNAYYASTDMRGSSLTTSVALELEEEYAGMDADQKAWVDDNWTRWEACKGDDLLIDVNGRESIGMMELVGDVMMDAGAMAEFGMLDLTAMNLTKGDVVIEVDMESSEEPAIPVGDLDEGIWTLNTYSNDILVYTRDIDIYNSANPMTWTTEEAIVDSFTMFYSNDVTGQTLKMPVVEKEYVDFTDVNGDTQKVIKVTKVANWAGNEPSDKYYTVQPIHSKAYYELYAGKGVSIAYGFYVETDLASGNTVDHAFWFGNSTVVNVPKKDTWYENTLSLDTILANWDLVLKEAPEGTYSWSNRHGMAMGYIGDWDRVGKGASSTFYFKGFEASVDLSSTNLDGGDLLVKLDEVEDKTALDLTAYMKAEDVETIAEVAQLVKVSYELKGYSIADTIAVTDLTAVDVSSAKEAAYVLNVKAGGATFYTAMIDLYSSTSPVVWAESLTAYNVVARKSANLTGAYYTNNVESTGTVDFTVVDTFTEGSTTGTGSFAKFEITEAMNLAIDIKPLHTKSFYREMVSLTKVLHLRGYASTSTTMQIMSGMNNYGMNSAYVSKGRQGFSGAKLESFVFSLHNNLIANSAAETANGLYYDYWESIEGTNLGMCRPLITLELTSTVISKGTFKFYFGISGDHIVDAGETLVYSSKYTTTSVDLNGEYTYDLINLVPESQHARYKAMAALWAGKNGKYVKGNAIGWRIGFNIDKTADKNGNQYLSTTNHNDAIYYVAAAADGSTIIDLNTQVTEEYTLGQLISLYSEDIWIMGYAPPVVSMGVGSWPVTMAAEVKGFKFTNLPEITFPEPEEPALDLSAYNMTEEQFTVVAGGTTDFTAKISAENTAKLDEIKAAGYELTYVMSSDAGEQTVTEADAKAMNDTAWNWWTDSDLVYTISIKVVDGDAEYTVLTGTFVCVYE